MSIERASVAEHWPYTPDKSTLVQKLQRKQWQALGTLHRTRANLRSVLELAINPIDRQQVYATITLMDRLIYWNLHAQRHLPSKKNKKLGIVQS